MHDYLLSAEWVRFAFVCGIAVSMLLYERRHLTTGSIVVPGYIAVFIIHPLVLVATFLNALVTYALVNRVLRRYVLLYGRTKFTVLAVASTLIQTAMLRLSPSGPWLWERDIPLFVGAGYIVPGLIAHDMARQGIAKTTKSVLTAGVIVAIPIAIAIAIDLPGINSHTPIGGFGTLAFPVRWLPVAVVISITASLAVARNYAARSGGFIGAALLGMFMADPWQIAAALLIAIVSYVIVAKVLMKHMILFGRRKFSAMLLTSSSIAWPALWLGDRFLDPSLTQHLAVGSLALTPLLLPGLIANDMQRTSPARVAFGLTLAALCTVTTTWWIGASITGQHLAVGWKAASAATILVLGWPQFVQLVTRTSTSMGTWVPALTSGIRARLTVDGPRLRRAPTVALARATEALRTATDGGHRRALGASPLPAFAPPLQLALVGYRIPTAPERRVPATRHREVRVGWRDWASEHPDAASDAEAWLDATLTAPAIPVVSPIAAAPPVPAANRPASSEFDLSTRQILAGSLTRPAASGQGFAPDPGWSRRPGRAERPPAAAPHVPPAPTTAGRVEPVDRVASHAPPVMDETHGGERIDRVVRALVERAMA